MTLIWKKLLLNKQKYVTKKELEKLCKEINKDYNMVIRYLQEQKLLIRILRGIFYVRSANEVEIGYNDTVVYKMIANALEKKKIFNWYL